MKNWITLIITALVSSFAFGQNAEIIVQKVDNGGIVPGETYRLYVELPTPQHSLHAVFGDDINDMSIESTAPFYQHQYGGQTSVDVNAAVIDMAPEVAFDSWVTIGARNASNNNLWDIGIEFDQFESGSNLMIQDGAWFLVPTDGYTLPEMGDLVLIAQLTTEGQAQGLINIQGWDADLQPWQARQLPFSTKDAKVFGCTNPLAENYNEAANYDDNSCILPDYTSDNVETALVEDDTNWQIFPNPIWEGQFHIQFSQVIDLKKGNMTVDIIDLSGKTVHAVEVDESNIIGGNKLIITKDLASGVYNVVIHQADMKDSQQIVVQK